MENKKIKDIFLFVLACVVSFGCGYLFSNALKAKEKSRLLAPVASVCSSLPVNFNQRDQIIDCLRQLDKFVDKKENVEEICKASKEVVLAFCHILLFCLDDPEVQNIIQELNEKTNSIIYKTSIYELLKK